MATGLPLRVMTIGSRVALTSSRSWEHLDLKSCAPTVLRCASESEAPNGGTSVAGRPMMIDQQSLIGFVETGRVTGGSGTGFDSACAVAGAGVGGAISLRAGTISGSGAILVSSITGTLADSTRSTSAAVAWNRRLRHVGRPRPYHFLGRRP